MCRRNSISQKYIETFERCIYYQVQYNLSMPNYPILIKVCNCNQHVKARVEPKFGKLGSIRCLSKSAILVARGKC